MGIIDEKYIINYVKNNLSLLSKKALYDIAKDINSKVKISMNKSDFINIIKESNIDYMEIYKKNKAICFGVSSSVMQKLLNVNNNNLKRLAKKKIVKVEYYVEKRLYGSYCDVPYYSLEELLNLDNKDIENNLSKATEKQIKALEKARKVSLDNRTCKICGIVLGNKNMLHNGMCKRCVEIERMENRINRAKLKFKEYLENKNDYLILDTESTGLGENDKIIEIAIIDMEGKVLMNTLVYTDVPIGAEANRVNGIKNEDLIGKPYFENILEELEKIIENKTLLIFNSEFDVRMLYQSGFKKEIPIKSECLMNLYMNYLDSDRWIGLQRALEYEDINIVQDHRALGDCYCCLKLIKKIGYKE